MRYSHLLTRPVVWTLTVLFILSVSFDGNIVTTLFLIGYPLAQALVWLVVEDTTTLYGTSLFEGGGFAFYAIIYIGTVINVILYYLLGVFIELHHKMKVQEGREPPLPVDI